MRGISTARRERYADAGLADVVVWAHGIFEGVPPEGRAAAMHRVADVLGLEPSG